MTPRLQICGVDFEHDFVEFCEDQLQCRFCGVKVSTEGETK